MDLKEKIFILFLIVAITFPFFFSKKEINIQKEIKLPNIVIKKANFKSYNKILEKNGNFETLNYFNQNNYTATNLKVNFLTKKSKLYAKKMEYNLVYNFFNATYINKDYTYKSKYAIYNDKNKTLTAYNFTFFNKNIDGKGEKMVYKNDILTAYNIVYNIKGLK